MLSRSKVQQSILGISFDGLAISGIVNEFLNVAWAVRNDKCRVLFDPGFDITAGRTADTGHLFLPEWVETVRCITPPPKEYCSAVVEDAADLVISGTSIAKAGVYDDLCNQLAELLVKTFQRENVHLLIVENGTLPDNPLFTEALYSAIAEYGAQREFGKYVLWRDHDLMWSAEPHLYGAYPYAGVRKPAANPHIHFAVITKWMQLRMRAWAPTATYHIIPNRFFPPIFQPSTENSLRAAYEIPENAYLIARCTRVISQKTIERDLRLLSELQRRLAMSKDGRQIFLFVTGPTKEDNAEFERLHSLERVLSIEGQVIWGDGLLPFNPSIVDSPALRNRFSVLELLLESDLSSFLTSYDYEGFGNPPGEAMAMGVPFISTTYELYQEVYGNKGVVAPLLRIDRGSSADDPIPEDFLQWTLRILEDADYREQIIKHNLSICRRFFSINALKKQLDEMFPLLFRNEKLDSGDRVKGKA